MITRRSFLQALGIGAAALAIEEPVRKLWFVPSNAPVGSRIERYKFPIEVSYEHGYTYDVSDSAFTLESAREPGYFQRLAANQERYTIARAHMVHPVQETRILREMWADERTPEELKAWRAQIEKEEAELRRAKQKEWDMISAKLKRDYSPCDLLVDPKEVEEYVPDRARWRTNVT